MKGLVLVPVTFILTGVPSTVEEPAHFSERFDVDADQLTPTGKSPYLILIPGYSLTLTGVEDDQPVELVITVLDQTRVVDGVETRVVEERETVDGRLVEVSRNYLAMSAVSGDVFYFGEDVDIYRDGKVVGHSGAWLAGEDGNRFGLLMPGSPDVGQRYYQEIAPGVAMDRAEIIRTDGTVETPAGTFTNVLEVEETSAMEPDAHERKYHAAGIGLIAEEDLKLTRHGMRSEGTDE